MIVDALCLGKITGDIYWFNANNINWENQIYPILDKCWYFILPGNRIMRWSWNWTASLHSFEEGCCFSWLNMTKINCECNITVNIYVQHRIRIPRNSQEDGRAALCINFKQKAKSQGTSPLVYYKPKWSYFLLSSYSVKFALKKKYLPSF